MSSTTWCRQRWLAASVGAFALAGCGGGGGGSTVTTSTAAPSGSGVVTVVSNTAASTVTAAQADAVRLAKQATFGPTQDVVDRIQAIGTSAWLDEQFAATGSSYADLAADEVPRNYCDVNDNLCYNLHHTRRRVAMRFYADAVTGQDQLRQRVALVLSEIMVANARTVNSTAGLASLNQIFLANAFGNYRDILRGVTMSSFMGRYLDMADSTAAAPSENYAREFLQLFTMGPEALNADGTPQHDSTGASIPNYDTTDIKAVARALTGWTLARLSGAPITNAKMRDYSHPMVVSPGNYDTAEKRFLGTTVPAGTSQQDCVDRVIDAAFNHPSTPPHVAQILIRHLVTANPSPGYVSRVSAAFRDNGSGVRGDLKAVVRAILTDSEARGTARTDSGAGKLKEPVLLMTSIARLIGYSTDGYAFTLRDGDLGEPVLEAPSVFNFYPPDYPLPGNATLVSPVSKLLTTTTAIRWHNLVYDWTIDGDQARSEFTASSGITGDGTHALWTDWTALGDDTNKMLDRIDLLMLAGTMTPTQRSALKAAADAISDADAGVRARRRAQAMLYAVASSPQFLVDR